MNPIDPDTLEALRLRARHVLTEQHPSAPTPTPDFEALVYELQIHQAELELQNEELCQTQLALSDSRDRYADLYEFAPVGYLGLDKEFRIQEANLTVASMLGMERGRLTGELLTRFIAPESQDDFYFHRHAFGVLSIKTDCELALRAATGEAFMARFDTIAFEPQEKRPCYFMTVIDISREKRAAQELEVSETRYRRLVNAITDHVYTSQVSANCVVEITHGPNFERFTGYSRNELMDHGDLWMERVPEPDRESLLLQRAQLLAGQEPRPMEHRFLRKNGEYCWVLNMPVPQYDDQGHLVSYDSIIREITERKREEARTQQAQVELAQRAGQVEEALEQRDEDFRMLAENVPGMFAFVGADRCFRFVNNEYRNILLGGSDIDLTGRPLAQILGKENYEVIEAHVDEVLDGKRVSFEACIPAQPNPRWMRATYAPHYDEHRAVDGFLAHMQDITERKEVELKLLEQRKALRRLSSEISQAEERERKRIATELHDGLNQLLTMSHNELECIDREALSESSESRLERARELLNQALGDIRSMTFRFSSPLLHQLGLEAALDQLCKDLSAEHPGNFIFEGPRSEEALTGALGEVLFRAVRELLINVVKHANAAHTRVFLYRKKDAWWLRIEDNGEGFDDTEAGRQFSPSGGFGLFSIHECLAHLGGRMSIRSRAGAGTRVMLEVPLEDVPGSGTLNADPSDSV